MKETVACTSPEIKVSVIVPIYNAEKYLPQCLDSVLCQTLRELELICVDDGSTDDSLKILEQYTKKDSRLKYISIDNHGAGYARNIGLAEAAGEYLFFLDSDDYIKPSALSEAYSYIDVPNTDMVIFGASYIDKSGREIGKDGIYGGILQDGDWFSIIDIPDRIFQVCSCNTWDKLYKRSFVLKNCIEYQNIRTSNDLYFVYMALALAENIRVLDKPLTIHRVHQGGNLQSIKSKSPMDFIQALEKLKTELINRDLWTCCFKSFINCALYHCFYNFETVDEKAMLQYRFENTRIHSLIELENHERSFYYDKSSLEIVQQKLEYSYNGEQNMLKKLKAFSKKCLPLPVMVFMREIDSLTTLLLEIQDQLALQKKQTAMLMREYSAQLIALRTELDETKFESERINARLDELERIMRE